MPETPSESPRLPFEIEARLDPSLVPAHAGVPLVSELVRRLGAAQVVHAQVRTKPRQRGVTPAQWVETRIALWTAGGDRGQDLETLRADAALAALLGDEWPAATTMRDFLGAVHAEALPLLRAGEQAALPEESAPLAGVGAANQRVLAAGRSRRRTHGDAGCGGDDPGGRRSARRRWPTKAHEALSRWGASGPSRS